VAKKAKSFPQSNYGLLFLKRNLSRDKDVKIFLPLFEIRLLFGFTFLLKTKQLSGKVLLLKNQGDQMSLLKHRQKCSPSRARFFY
jgi:hypothetical protein